MKINLRVHSNSSQEKIKRLSNRNYEIWVKEKPVEGKANKRITRVLKKHFKKNIKIIKGAKSKNKIIQVI